MTDQRSIPAYRLSEASVLMSASLGALTAFAAVLAIVLMGRMQEAEDALALGTAEPEAAARSGRSPWVVPLLSALAIVGVLVIAAGIATTPDYSGTWAKYADDDGSFSVELPGTPTVRPVEGGRMHELDRGVSLLQVGIFDLGTNVFMPAGLDAYAAAFAGDRELLEPTQEAALGLHPARRLRLLDDNGYEATQILSGEGHRLVIVSERSFVRGSTSELDRVLESFRFTGDSPPAEPPSEPELARILPG